VQANVDEDTYAAMDLFDWLDVVNNLKKNGVTKQKDIAQKLGWSKDTVSDYCILIEDVSAHILKLAKQYQKGRADKNSATAEFTEGWFRTSGLYDLRKRYQRKFMQRYREDKFNWNKSKAQQESAKYKQWQEFIMVAKEELYNSSDFRTLFKLIEKNTFKAESQLRIKINDMNKLAANKLICGDAIQELEKLDDCSIDLVITDPPYGIDYSSNRSKFEDHVTKENIANDKLKEALNLLNDTCEVISRKTKSDAHIYIFTSYKTYSHFEAIIQKYFNVKNMIVWDKGNHGAGDLEGSWGNRHELIIFATKGNRKINKRKADIINISKVSSGKAIHSTQKPEVLIKEILEVSAQPADTICDPFMGSGSTIKAIKEHGNLNYIGIELDNEKFEKAKAYIGGSNTDE